MSGAMSRRKGAKGRREAIHLFNDRDWQCDPTYDGIKSDDIVVMDPNGKRWSVEVKNTKAITVAHREQAKRQAKVRSMPWILISKIHGTKSWIIQRHNHKPVVWHEKVCISGSK